MGLNRKEVRYVTEMLEMYLMHPWDCHDESAVTPYWPRYHCVHCCGAACLHHLDPLHNSPASKVAGNVYTQHT